MADDASGKGDSATEAPKGEHEQAPVPAKRKLVVAKTDKSRAPTEDTNKVVDIVRRLEEETRRRRGSRRSPWIPILTLATVVLPTVVAALFYLFIASDRFVSEANFAVRSNDAQAMDSLGMVIGLPTSQTTSNSYIVADYVVSRDMVRELERRLPLREMYSNADFISRVSPAATLEDLVAYWARNVDVYYDSTKKTIAVQVQAFDAASADRITREIIDIVKNLVNGLSAQARRDAVAFAVSEVAHAELRVRDARDAILKFRISHNDLDPTQTATATLEIAAQLEGERSKLASDLASLSGYLADDAPSMQMLKSRIAALAGEISRIQGQVSGSDQQAGGRFAPAMADSNSLATVVGMYQELTLSQEFAEKSYAAALASLERARGDAERTQSFLAIYGQPTIAGEAAYPRRWLNIWIVFLLTSILWAIGLLGIFIVKDQYIT